MGLVSLRRKVGGKINVDFDSDEDDHLERDSNEADSFSVHRNV